MSARDGVVGVAARLKRSFGRRRLFTQTASVGVAGLGAAVFSAPPAGADPTGVSPRGARGDDTVRPFPGARVGPNDPRYATLSMGFNQRWVGTPSYIELVANTGQVVRAVRDAVHGQRRITVRGGGHCYEDFVSANAGGVIIDMSQMNAVYLADDGTFCAEGGATNWDAYEQLYKGYGVTLPGGSCYSVGLGGHVCGGGYGLLSRKFGLIVDYLAAVEVVVVDRDRTVRSVTAVPGDPHTADLFWAHTGGGGGNFGVITRYYFRDLPQPPQQAFLATTTWNWQELTPERFRALLTNYGQFMLANSAPGSPYSDLFALLKLTHRSAGQISMTTQFTGAHQRLLDDFLGQVAAGVGSSVSDVRRMPWLQATQTLNGSGPNQRGKYKSAYMVQPFPLHQIDSIYRALIDTNYANPQALLQVDSYGCQINTRNPHETAVAQRSSIMKLQYQTYWTDPAKDDDNLRWIRRFYADVYSPTGGIPQPDGVTDGCYVNYPDVDLQNWPELYYKDNYARLQRVKARWDPNDIFHHRQSIRAS